jgi:hypothetical protein
VSRCHALVKVKVKVNGAIDRGLTMDQQVAGHFQGIHIQPILAAGCPEGLHLGA